ncbi:PadR family transcriptional regulator [Tomitella cavernea]|uniref:PadR family transcriptional regulator n=1 Tax=Tomitella cavernea TaxID=1387982 RepID=UPI001902D9E5|nr:PadR family transcriptional regulator [Tomitella cavernea]
MALEHAILVALSERAGSGYELARRFDKSIGFFYGASHQQIYRTLKRMTADGWVTCEAVPQNGRPDKKVYAVGGPGAAELRDWLTRPSDPSTIRDELSVKIRAASYGDASAVLAEVRRHGGEHLARWEAYSRMLARDFPDPGALTPMQLHQFLVLRGGIRIEQSLVEWCDEVAAALDGAHPDAHAPDGPTETARP